MLYEVITLHQQLVEFAVKGGGLLAEAGGFLVGLLETLVQFVQ